MFARSPLAPRLATAGAKYWAVHRSAVQNTAFDCGEKWRDCDDGWRRRSAPSDAVDRRSAAATFAAQTERPAAPPTDRRLTSVMRLRSTIVESDGRGIYSGNNYTIRH